MVLETNSLLNSFSLYFLSNFSPFLLCLLIIECSSIYTPLDPLFLFRSCCVSEDWFSDHHCIFTFVGLYLWSAVCTAYAIRHLFLVCAKGLSIQLHRSFVIGLLLSCPTREWAEGPFSNRHSQGITELKCTEDCWQQELRVLDTLFCWWRTH